MRKRRPLEGQGSLFSDSPPRAANPPVAQRAEQPASQAPRQWRMPEVHGRTVAEIRLRWLKRLTPGQVARVEAELSSLPGKLSKLGYGRVEVEHAFVHRRKK